MAIQKKSLISKLNTTKKAIVASSTPAENPSVSAPVTSRRREMARKVGGFEMRKRGFEMRKSAADGLLRKR